MERRSANGEFRANFALGGTVSALIIDEEMRRIARTMYETTGLEVFGLDLLYGRDGYLFCELNVTPGLEGIEKATGINAAGAVMNHVLRQME